MSAKKGTGAGGYVQLSGVQLTFNSIEPEAELTVDDATDSDDYDPASGLVHESSLPVSTKTTFSIEGKVDLNKTPTSLIAPVYTSSGPYPCYIAMGGGAIYGHGNVWVTNFKGTIDPQKVMTFTASLQTTGKFTPGS